MAHRLLVEYCKSHARFPNRQIASCLPLRLSCGEVKKLFFIKQIKQRPQTVYLIVYRILGFSCEGRNLALLKVTCQGCRACKRPFLNSPLKIISLNYWLA